MTAIFSSNETVALERSVDTNNIQNSSLNQIWVDADLINCVNWIANNSLKRVKLKFKNVLEVESYKIIFFLG